MNYRQISFFDTLVNFRVTRPGTSLVVLNAGRFSNCEVAIQVDKADAILVLDRATFVENVNDVDVNEALMVRVTGSKFLGKPKGKKR